MPDKEKRPWWQVRRVQGAALGAFAAGLAVVPNIYCKIGAAALGWLATNVFSYGVGAAVERDKK